MRGYKFHYGFVILAVGVLVVAGSLGFDRFSYGMILPSMQASLNLNATEIGIIASGNMFGYLLAALIAGLMASKYGPRLVIGASMLIIGVAMAITSLANSVLSLVLLRFITGVASAGGNISVMGLTASWFSSKRRGMANGVLVGGSGIAVAVSGWLVPFVNRNFPEMGWRYNWFIIGIIVIIFGLISISFIRNHPKEKDLEPLGGRGQYKELSLQTKKDFSIKDVFSTSSGRILALIYFCFGVSYIIYTMFFVSYLVGEKGITELFAGNIWSSVGLLSIGSAVFWGSLSDMFGRGPTLFIIFVLQTISYLLPVITSSTSFIWLSAILFGLTAWSIPAIVSSYCGDIVGPKNAPAILGVITVFFGLGQVIGPIAAGYIKELSQSYTGAFFVASSLACIGGISALWSSNIEKQSPSIGDKLHNQNQS